MPIYEYECAACGHREETIQKISDKPLKDCPECGKPKLNKMVSAAAFRLKGGGWYETDFKSGDKKNGVDSDKKPKSDGGSTQNKTDNAPAKKSSGSTTTKKDSK